MQENKMEAFAQYSYANQASGQIETESLSIQTGH